ncbi:hypothetical protein VSR69_38660 [Paraburkholderia phytofirmans]
MNHVVQLKFDLGGVLRLLHRGIDFGTLAIVRLLRRLSQKLARDQFVGNLDCSGRVDRQARSLQ